MTLNSKWVPMKWPCGPAEFARLKATDADAELMKVAEAWTQPSTLQLLKGTPVNCLVVDWAAGVPWDRAQQLALEPLIHAGRQLGISFVGKVKAGLREDLQAAVAAGRAAGLEAVILTAILDDSESRALGLPVILQQANDNIEWDVTTPIFSATSKVWPGANLKTIDGNTATAGPTVDPWADADSNGCFSLIARQMAPDKTLWLDIDPPWSTDTLSAESYCLAIGDSRVYGSRWIVSLDYRTRAGMLGGDSRAMGAWTRICQTISFFENHADWEAYRPMGSLAVISDFAGENMLMSGAVLTFLNRNQVQLQVFDRTRALAGPDDGPIEGLKGILWMDDAVPTAEQKSRLLAFVKQGGLVIATSYWGPPGVTPQRENWLFGYSIYSVLNGKFVVAENGVIDPNQLARDTHLLVGRRNDLARLYNPGRTNCYSSIHPNHLNQVIQVLNYSTGAASYVTLWVNTRSHSAKLWRPNPQDSLVIDGVPANEGTDFGLPPFSVNCAVEIEKLASL